MSGRAHIVLLEFARGLEILGTPPVAAIGTAYTFAWSATGGLAPYTYALTGTLPATFTWDAPTATLASTSPTTPDSEALTLTVTDAARNTVQRSYTLRVQALPLQISGSIPAGTFGVAWTTALTVSGGVTPYVTSQVVAGPSWMSASIAGATITVSGTPDADWNAPISIKVTDSDAVSATFTGALVVVYSTLTLTGTYADGSIGVAYSSDLTVSGGNGTYSLTGGDGVTVGSLPAGLALSIVGSALRLSGTPTAAFSTSFTVSVDSGDGQTATSVQSPAIAEATKPVYLPVIRWDGAYMYTVGRIKPDLTYDSSWATPGAMPNAYGILVDHDGGYVYATTNAGDNLFRFDIFTGAKDTGFDPVNAGAATIPLIVAPDGDIVFFIRSGTVNGVVVGNAIVKVSPSGVIDSSYTIPVSSSFSVQINGRVPDGSGGMYVYGTFNAIGGVTRTDIAHIDSTGLVDTSFPDIGNGFFYASGFKMMMARDSSGRLWVANGEKKCVRFLSNGDVDFTATFPTTLYRYVRSVAVDSQGRVYMGGNTLAYEGNTRYGIVRLNENGTFDSSFDANANIYTNVNALMLQTDARLFVSAEAMTTIGGKSRERFAVLDTSTCNEIGDWVTGSQYDPKFMAQ